VLVVDAEEPAPEGPVAVLLDVGVLLSGRRAVLAPGVAVVDDRVTLLDESSRVVVAALVEANRHGRVNRPRSGQDRMR
jgi:hypothetical protein